MKTLKFAFALIAGLIALFFLIGLALPAKFAVSRSEVMSAPPDSVYAWVATPKKWPEWSSWNPKERPGMKFSFEGPETGAGAAMRLSGDHEGSGVLRIVDGAPKTGVHYTVTLDNGMQIHGTFAFEPNGTRTKVTWTDTGEISNPGMRYFGLFVDKALGPHFEAGLAELKKRVEVQPAAAAPTTTAPAPTETAKGTP